MSDIENLFNCFEENGTVVEPIKSNAYAKEIERCSKRKANNDTEQITKTYKRDIMQEPDIDPHELNPQLDIHLIAKDDGCLHEAVVPNDQKFPKLVTSDKPPAKTYKFKLDPFQEKAILCIENNHSVMVSAHTSAGKTVVAEYAIALALKNKQRVIYTTPIKALSNQKYREMLDEFKDVGIMTGDITIDPMASCLIMTTEILRSMLFKGSEITKEVGWVIFDEIHYMRDQTRGVVWEETLIMLPDNVRYVFLSATIPNARQFAEWVCHLHRQPCHVVYTEFRPTPLQHYLFPVGSKKMYLVIDEQGKLIEKNFEEAMDKISPDNNNSNKLMSKEDENVFNVVKILMDMNLAPLIIFSFKKKNCEKFALCLSKLNFNTDVEQKLVEEVFNNAIDVLNEEEKKLPQVTTMLPLLKKGIAFHHSGLLPLIKEIVEILFGEGLIKALFATETFAMGLNMPAKTVIFTSISKFDGVGVRNVSSGEYIQMSGRAGRRGKDVNGLVVMMIDEKISSDLVTNIIMGKPDSLNSAFHLTYNMILNLMRQEEINPEYMIQRSFFMFQTHAKLMELYKVIKSKQKKYSSIRIDKEEMVASYNSIVTQLESLHDEVRKYILDSTYLLPFLTRGRFIKLKSEFYEYDWGVVMGTETELDDVKIAVMLHVHGSSSKNVLPKPTFNKKRGRVIITTVDYRLIHQVSSLKADIFKLGQKKRNKEYLKKLFDLKTKYPHGLPLIHPIKDMGIKNAELEDIINKIRNLEKLLSLSPIFHQDNESILNNYNRKEELYKELTELHDEVTKLKSLTKMDELERRKNVLRKLGYCNEIDVINIKGRVACELSCVDELLLTELIFNGIFNELPVEYCVALLSGFICQEVFPEDDLSHNVTIYRAMKLSEDITSMIGNIALECKLIATKEEYTEASFKSHLVEIVLAWCKGSSFLNICKMTKIYEGSIIRYLRILEEVLRQLCKAATNVGNTDLENRFSEGIRILKRGVVFAGSLYL